MKLEGPLPDHFLSKLPPEERKKLGRAGMTSEEAQARYEAKTERELQKQIWQFLRRNQIYFVQPRIDKKTTTRKGTPDFIAACEGAFVAIETKCKNTKGQLTKEQEEVMAEVLQSGGIYLLVYSLEEVQQAFAHVIKIQ
jgi:hypothetical protein